MAQALEKRGIEYHLARVTGGGHGFDGDGQKPEVKRLFEGVIEFLQNHLE